MAVAAVALAAAQRAKPGNPARVSHLSVWPVIVIAFLIAAVTIVATGGLAEGVFFALLLFLLLGALFPPVMIPIGVVVLVYIAYKGNVVGSIGNWTHNLTAAKAQPAQPLPPFGIAGDATKLQSVNAQASAGRQ